MPAQTGIQEPQAEAVGETAWIPAFAGMTFLRPFRKTSLTDYYEQR